MLALRRTTFLTSSRDRDPSTLPPPNNTNTTNQEQFHRLGNNSGICDRSGA
jgi:hypothetical protein